MKADTIHQLANGRWVIATWSEQTNQWTAPMTALERKVTGCYAYFAKTLEGLGATSYYSKKAAVKEESK